MGDTALALRACAEGLSFDAEDAELWFRKGVVHRQRGESAEAESCWRRILGLSRPERFASLDMGIYGHLTRRNLAALARERGDVAEEGPALEGGARRMPRRPRGTRHARAAERGDPGPSRARNRCEPGAVDHRRLATEHHPRPRSGGPRPVRSAGGRLGGGIRATVVVELGVRFGASTRAMLDGVRAVNGHVWGVNPLERHDVRDPLFTYVQSDPMAVVDRWERIDLLHVEIDPHCEDDARRWLGAYAGRCRAIVVHDTHHPRSRLAAVVGELAAAGRWRAFEYRDGSTGWTVLVRPGEPCPTEDAASNGEARPVPSAV